MPQKKHEGQTRWNGDPYITHPIRVSESKWINNEDCRIAAILHDVLEDTACTEEEITTKFGHYISSLVWRLTHFKDEKYVDYIVRVSKEEGSIRVKLADLEDNMQDLRKGSMKDKYEFAHFYLIKQLIDITKKDLNVLESN